MHYTKTRNSDNLNIELKGIHTRYTLNPLKFKQMSIISTKSCFVIVLICFASFTLSQVSTAQVASKSLLTAKNGKSAPELSLVKKNRSNSADKKAPFMVLDLKNPTLEVFNHTLRILVTCDKNVFQLKGKASDKLSGIAGVAVGGKKVNVDAYGSFQTQLSLSKQYTVVSVVAYDNSGNKLIKELAIKTTAKSP